MLKILLENSNANNLLSNKLLRCVLEADRTSTSFSNKPPHVIQPGTIESILVAAAEGEERTRRKDTV